MRGAPNSTCSLSWYRLLGDWLSRRRLLWCWHAGCGKTTLLSVLAGSVSSLSHNSKLYGHVTMDGQPRRSWASRLVAYVPQFDFLLPTLTVAETLRYSAQLRLPRTATAAEVKVLLSPSKMLRGH